MHEKHMVEAAIEAIKAEMKKDGSRLVCARFAVGELSGIDPQSIKFYFEELARGSVLEGAQLEFSSAQNKSGLVLIGIETK